MTNKDKCTVCGGELDFFVLNERDINYIAIQSYNGTGEEPKEERE